MKAIRVIGNIIKWFVITILSIVLLFNITIMIKSYINPDKVPDIFGYKPFIVLSGSMEDTIKVGDLAIVKNVDVSTLDVNDIISFKTKDKSIVTHRIIELVTNGNEVCYRTKGDNNNTSDEDVVCSKDVEGKYLFRIPKVGHLVVFLQEPTGITILILIIIIISLIVYLYDSSNDESDKEVEIANLKEKLAKEEVKEEIKEEVKVETKKASAKKKAVTPKKQVKKTTKKEAPKKTATKKKTTSKTTTKKTTNKNTTTKKKTQTKKKA